MASFRIEWKRSAQKELRAAPRKIVPRIVESVAGLAEDPFPHGSRKLSGSEHTYPIRIGDYRVIYDVLQKEIVIEVIRVGHRRDVYRT